MQRMPDKYANQDLLCYAFFLPNGGLRVYPRYVLAADGRMELIRDAEEVFSPHGAIFFPETNLEQQWSESSSILQLRYQRGMLETNAYPGENKDFYIGKSRNGVRVFPFRYGCSFPCLPVSMSSTALQQELQFSYRDTEGNLISVPDASMYVYCADKKILGPFKYEFEKDEIKLTGKKAEDYTIKVYNATQLPIFPLKGADYQGTTLMHFIPKAAILNVREIDSFDCMSELSLKDYLIEALKTHNQHKLNLGQIKSALSALVSTGAPISESRKEKIKALIGKAAQIQELNENITKMILADGGSTSDFLNAIATARPKFFSDWIAEKVEKQPALLGRALDEMRPKSVKPAAAVSEEQVANYKKRLSDMEAALNKAKSDANEAKGLAKDISELRLEKSKEENEIQELKEKKDALKKELENIKKQRETSEEELHERNARLNQLFENKFKRKIELLEEKIGDYQQATNGFVDIVDKQLLQRVQKVISDAEEKNKQKLSLSNELAEISTKERVEHPITTSTMSKDERLPLPVLDLDYNLNRLETGKKIIGRVAQFLKSANRYVSDDEVANYLICLTQGFITTFAGSPGSGKTSLCNLLAQALGLVNGECRPHFIDVPVARGWTSSRDLIGYYNPLSQTMVKSNAMLFDALNAASNEDSESAPPLMVLLDEANLSSIEHYWSAFLKNSDFSSSVNRSFSLGGEDMIPIVNHLRFVATVNHDHTTEELSPRFLDRSWVIMLQPTSGAEEDYVDTPAPKVEPAVPFGAMQKAFGSYQAEENYDEDSSLYEFKLNEIKEIFKKHRIPIMPRSLKMVLNYTKIASLYMSEEYKALDYAVAQKLLPSLNGNGTDFKNCLEELQTKCANGALPLCHRLLGDMIQAGDEGNMNIYDFFAR